jgi:hypothetical protein
MKPGDRRVLNAVLLLGLIAFLSGGPSCSREPRHGRDAAGGGAVSAPVIPANGFYAVTARASTADSARAASPGSAVLVYDQKYTAVDPNVTPEYVAIDTTFFVPLILDGPPEARPDGRGWTMLSVSLAGDQVKPLEDFSRAHLGGRVAIVIGGEIISMHKVREVLTGGKVQITRCVDNACQVLYTKLMQK